ncbi:g9145 [Coccomyxa elongata]
MATPVQDPVLIPDPHPTTMRFVSCMSAPRTKPEDKRKNIQEWTLADAERARSKLENLCEFLSADRPWTKPFFDTESYHPTQPTDHAIQDILERCLLSVDKVMEDQPGYDRSHVRVGQRHGIDPKHDERYKVSFRMWVTGFKVQYPQLRELLDLKGVGGDGEGLLDKSVYKGPEQLLNCMGCCKGSLRAGKGVQKVDKRLLKATDHDEPWSTYLVQHLRGDERPMILPAIPTTPVARPAHPTRPQTLDVFLKARLAARGAPHRFTSASKPFGSYWVSEADVPRFYDLYTSHLQAGKHSCLTERQGALGLVVVDIDLRFPRDAKERRYTSDTVRSVVMAYQHSLMAHMTLADDLLLCYVLERTSPYQTEKATKDGFHLVFPHARADKPLKDTLRVEAMARCGDALKATGSHLCLEEMVDGKVVNWYVYGSGKPNVPPYLLTRVLGADGKVVPVTHTLRDLVELLRVSEQGDDILTSLGALKVSDQPLEATRQSPGALHQPPDDAAVEEVSFELLDRVVMGLSVSRADAPEPDWMQVVWPVWNVSTDNKYLRMGRDLVHRFSKQAPDRYDEEEVEAKLNSLKPRPPGQLRKHFGTLRHMLKGDNAELHGELFELDKVGDYKQVKEGFEKNHFKVMTPLQFATVAVNGVVTFKKRRDFMDTYENLSYVEEVNGKTEMKKFVPKWLQDRQIRTYSRADFLPPPLSCSTDVYNMYPGLRAERLQEKLGRQLTPEEADVTVPLDLLSKLCGADEDCLHYVVKWFAQMVQEPGRLSGVALIWYSEEEGVGKNVFSHWFGNQLLGSQLYFTTSDVKRLLGQFADGLVNRVLINLDEAKGSDTHGLFDQIKNRITAEETVYERKGVDQMKVQNSARWLGTTNNLHGVKVGVNDRRHVAVKCVGTHANDAVYFARVREWMSKDTSVVAFYQYLRGLDLSGVDWVGDRPKTKLWQTMRGESLPLMARFLMDHAKEMPAPPASYSAADFCAMMNSWLFINKFGFTMTQSSFGRAAASVSYAGFTKRRSNKGFVYEVNPTEVVRGMKCLGYLESLGFLSDSDDED